VYPLPLEHLDELELLLEGSQQLGPLLVQLPDGDAEGLALPLLRAQGLGVRSPLRR
jgi:hypothetical protein